MLFFVEISILCQRSKKLNGLKKCDWGTLFQPEKNVSKVGSRVDRRPWAGGQLWVM